MLGTMGVSASMIAGLAEYTLSKYMPPTIFGGCRDLTRGPKRSLCQVVTGCPASIYGHVICATLFLDCRQVASEP